MMSFSVTKLLAPQCHYFLQFLLVLPFKHLSVFVCPQISGVKNYDSVGLVSSAFQNGSSSMADTSPHDSLRSVTNVHTRPPHHLLPSYWYGDRFDTMKSPVQKLMPAIILKCHIHLVCIMATYLHYSDPPLLRPPPATSTSSSFPLFPPSLPPFLLLPLFLLLSLRGSVRLRSSLGSGHTSLNLLLSEQSSTRQRYKDLVSTETSGEYVCVSVCVHACVGGEGRRGDGKA